MPLGSAVFNRVLQSFGSFYDARIVTTSFNTRGDKEETYTTGSLEGYVSVVGERDTAVQAGIINPGDAVGYFRTDSTNFLQQGSIAQVNNLGDWYEVWGNPKRPLFSGEQLISIVFLRKVQASYE